MNIGTMVRTNINGEDVMYGRVLTVKDDDGYNYNGFVYKNQVFLPTFDVMRIFGFTEFLENGDEIVYWPRFHKVFYKSFKNLGMVKEDYPLPFNEDSKFYKMLKEQDPNSVSIFEGELPDDLSEIILFRIFEDNPNLNKNDVEAVKTIIIRMRLKAIDIANGVDDK